jgi:ABC-type phosphate transport system substrate-binding protein
LVSLSDRSAELKERHILVVILAIVIAPTSNPARSSSFEREAEPALYATTSEPIAIVVNNSNSIDNLSTSELRQIFLGARTHWPNGRRITLVMREPGDPVRETILHNLCAMTEEQFTTHFVRGLYRGDILVSPKILSTASGVRRFIFNVPGAIGYARLSEVDDSVKTVLIDEHRPEDNVYRLRITEQAGH